MLHIALPIDSGHEPVRVSSFVPSTDYVRLAFSVQAFLRDKVAGSRAPGQVCIFRVDTRGCGTSLPLLTPVPHDERVNAWELLPIRDMKSDEWCAEWKEGEVA